MMKTMDSIPSETIPPALGRMIRVIGHDVRNKLAVMRNSAYYLKMKVSHGDEKVKKHLRILEGEIANANMIIMNLMDFALVKEPVLQESDLKTIIAEALSQASLPEHWEAGLHLDDHLPTLMADASQLQRAFTNIIVAIVQGRPESGRFQIRAKEQNGSVEVRFEVPDWVIPEEELEAITSPLDSASSTGVGMLVSKKLVERNGGSVEVKRFPEKGTVFTVRLPVAKGGARHERADQYPDS